MHLLVSNTETNEDSIPFSEKSKQSNTMANLVDITYETPAEVEEILKPFRLSNENLKEISKRLLKAMEEGLRNKTVGSDHPSIRPSVKMLSSHLKERPNGTENGGFLALDMGGTKLRAYYVEVMNGKIKLEPKSKEWTIPQELKNESGTQLFDYIVKNLGAFVETLKLEGNPKLPLGFSFSFPCDHKSLYKCFLTKWTKGFKCSGVERKDVAKLLREAIGRKGGLNIHPIVMVNDVVATMMSCEDENCQIGMIIGTGTNACYMEEMKNVGTEDGEEGQLCINTEWGGFGDDDSLKDFLTEFDKNLDNESDNPGEHIVEKMISGKYLGEIVWRVLLELKEKKLLFEGSVSDNLRKKDTFETRFISEIEDEKNGLENADKILSDLDLKVNSTDPSLVKMVCDTISSRSARLCAAALVTIANRIRTNRGLPHLKITVGMDGTVYKKHPNFSEKLKEALRTLSPECDINIKVVDDASGKGAALVAAVAQRLCGQQG
ncbi:hexokinase-2-like [Poecilia formosa]|uniref:hexokinase-2-like n=1 Tax=Poecilia formosa TaxID=48698 RepID=UPI0007B98B60|nr:PREDICTED: hexokinase-2-like [Poecilia formosa]